MKNPIRDIKIEIQRWMFRRKQKKAKAHDYDKMAAAILKAKRISERSKVRLWVVKLSYADYVILTKGQLKAFLRKLGIASKINIYQTNEYVVYITNKAA